MQESDSAIVACRARGGLPFLADKLADPARTVTVAYFGGSITWAPGYRVQTAEWLDAAFPARIASVNAGVGGTGSDLGVFRVGEDVIAHRPDLVFVEFAVNDFRLDRPRMRRTMEGLVRKIRRALPECALVFVYTLTEAMLDRKFLGDKPLDDWISLHEGRLFPSMRIHEDVAAHYGIPSISFAEPVLRLLAKDRLVFTVPPEGKDACLASGKIPFTPDRVHPYHDTGHRIYADAVVRYFGALLAAAPASPSTVLPAPLDPANWEHARTVDPADAEMTGSWRRLAGDAKPEDLRSFPDCWQGRGGDGLVLRFTGTAVGIMDMIGPRSGHILVGIDGGAPERVERFDRYCTWDRKHSVILADNLPHGEHTLNITVDPEVPDKKAILALREAATPAHADVAEWFPVCFLVN